MPADMHDYATLAPLLEPFGALRSQPASDWSGAPLPAELAQFYAQVGPWGETYHQAVGPVGITLSVGGNPVCIPPLHKLANLQAGYAWSRNPADPLPGWGPDWLVIAEQGGDPFIFDRASGHILFAFHGTGSWDPVFFAPDLRQGIGALATVANAFCTLDEDSDCDDDGLKPSERRARAGGRDAGGVGVLPVVRSIAHTAPPLARRLRK